MVDFVVLTNFSTAADKALHYATILAQQVPSKIHLVHIWQHSILDANYFIEEPVYSTYFNKVGVASRQEHEDALQKRCATFGERVVIEPHFIIGSIANKLPVFLKQVAYPIVIIGKCYTENIPDELVESTSIQLLSMPHTPLLIVPEKYQPLDIPKKIALALDGKTINPPTQLYQQVISPLQSVVDIIHISASPTEKIKENISRIAQATLGSTAARVKVLNPKEGSVMESMRSYLKVNHNDLLVLFHRKHSFLHYLFHQSITGSFVRHTSIPLLILPG